MGCCSSHAPFLSSRQSSTEELPPLIQQKTTCKEELRLSPSNYIMLVRGQLTANYEVLEKIGEGGYGTVWRAKHKSSGQLRAVKTLLKQSLDEEQREEMLTEVGVLRTLVVST